MGFLSFLLLAAITYLIWRITDQLPDLIFRISEVQRDVAELRRNLADAPTSLSKPASLTTTPRQGPAESVSDSI
ncbi:MAG: hypothetical protein NT024_09230 [Proteobacteria bacterium]|nr:hypothetical protein [Pseudomonadota bacterium]